MGHLVNAKGSRLGWSLIWDNFWYAPFDYYSMHLFLCMKTRAILKFLLFQKKMDKSHFIFSHFLISKRLNFLQIKIFFYFIPWGKLLSRYTKFLVQWVRNHFVPPKKRQRYFYWSSLYRLKLNEKYRKWIFEDIYRKYFPHEKWEFENENCHGCILKQGLKHEIPI